MAIRIYALAKQLKLDSKVLVDICTKAGVTGKGSALASLTDEELAKVTAFMEASKGGARSGAKLAAGAASGGAGSQAFRREDYIAPGGTAPGRVPVLPSKPLEKPAPPKKKAPEPVEPVVEVPEVVAKDGKDTKEAKEAKETKDANDGKDLDVVEKERPQEPPKAPSRPEWGPLRARLPDRVPDLERPRSEKDRDKDKDKEKDKDRDKERTAPAIKLARVPVQQRPTKKAKPAELPPQKPDIKLPRDAIRAGKAGTKPLSEHLRKHEQKKAAEARKGVARKPGALEEGEVPVTGAAETPAAGRERPRRGGVRPPVDEKEAGGTPALGGREQRQLKRKKSATVRRRTGDEEEDSTTPTRRRPHIRRTGASNTAAPRKGKIVVNLPCTIREFSETIGVPARVILGKMLELGTMSNIAATLDAESAELLAVELGLDIEVRREVALEEQVLSSADQDGVDETNLQPRPPVITFLGHVDHGKTSLLDRILGLDVASGEKGGITQHIRAYRIEKDGRPIAFVDTPGHEAFTAMRARGANVTDIAVLVVAADDGVMPQTEEAISHARAAGVPIVVALNKVDLPGANPERVYDQLARNDLLPTAWGGDTEVVKTSAVTGAGIDELLETLLTVAELREYKANPDRLAQGTCLEAQLHEGRGVVAKVLVQKGTLHVGDIIVCGAAFGRVKAMYDTLNSRKKYQEAGPSMPVDVTGLSIAPAAGNTFHALEDITQARQLAEQRAAASRQQELSGGRMHVTLENLFERLGQQDELQFLNIILRADVRGSIEAIRKELTKLQHPEVQIRILQATVGGITEADVHLADASDAVIIGFNVVPDEGARALTEQLGVQIRRYDIIYQVTDDLRLALEGMLRPEKQEKDLGRALVQRLFHISRIGTVAGCRVLSGTIQRDARIRVIRDNRVIGDYPLDSLKREKDDAREVREGYECGIRLGGFNDIKEGDVLEAYKIEEIRRSFQDSPGGRLASTTAG